MPELVPITEAEQSEAELPDATLEDDVASIVKHKFAVGLIDAAETILKLATRNPLQLSPQDAGLSFRAASYVIEFNLGKPTGHGKDDPLDKLLEAIRNDDTEEVG